MAKPKKTKPPEPITYARIFAGPRGGLRLEKPDAAQLLVDVDGTPLRSIAADGVLLGIQHVAWGRGAKALTESAKRDGVRPIPVSA